MEMEEKKGFIIAIIILILLVLSLGVYVAFDIIEDKKAAENKKTLIEDTEIDLNTFYQVAYTLDSFDKAFNNPKSSYIGYIYVSRKLSAAKFEMGAAIYASMIQDMTVSNPTARPFYIPESKVKNNFEKIFGKNLEYKVDTVKSGETYKVSYYNLQNDPPVRYDYYAPTEENVYSEKYIAVNYKTTLEKDKIIVNRRIAYAEFVPAADGKNYTSVILYKDHEKKSKIGTLELRNGYINEKQLLSSYASKMLKYNYTFVKDNNDNYRFYSIEAA